jgi:capsular polysaccharide transport system permease protein
MLFARAILEGLSTFASYLILISFMAAINVGSLPTRPFELIIGALLMFWFSFAVSLIVAAITHENRTTARLVHPITYLLMPFSGAFYQLAWVPEPYRTWLSWFPMTGIMEELRYGAFETMNNDYVDMPYITGVCLLCTYAGMVAIRMVRRHVHLR